ncbi:hypothetical protein AGMMS50268_03260 [Spirochaetia bacterium]|nr:hypothetical protein AGMMS50268_03260 [Spirochaetia bacterium]
MKFLNQSLDEKMQIDRELEEMKKYPVDCSDIPPVVETESNKWHLGNEHFLSRLPPDIVNRDGKAKIGGHESLWL